MVKNVLLITADQFRGDCLSAHGHAHVATPHLDALARDGTAFRQHFCQATPCAPSRASLLTGLYLMNHRVVFNGTPLDQRHDNIARMARRHGYDPVLFGYTDQTRDPRMSRDDDPWMNTYEGVLPGFRTGPRGGVMLDGYGQPWRQWLAARGVDVPANEIDLYLPDPQTYPNPGKHPSLDPPRFSSDETETAFLVGAFTDYAEKQGQSPWFAHLSFLRPHPPFCAPAPYNTLFDPAKMPPPLRAQSPANEGQQHPYLATLLGSVQADHYIANGQGLVTDFDDDDVAVLRAIYFAMIAEVDAQVGRLIAWLKAHDQYEDTLIIFTSDHGEMLGDHYLFGKSGYFDGAYHIPLIIRDPEATHQGHVVHRFTENIDIVPTILDHLGLAQPVTLDGRALTPFLNGVEPSDWRQEVHWEHDFRHAARQAGLPDSDHSDDRQLAVIRSERFKYVHFGDLPPLLFDLQEDPNEHYNRAGDPQYADVLSDLRSRMLSWRMRHSGRGLSHMLATADGIMS
jgi:arylsulfatase A-like enzyme